MENPKTIQIETKALNVAIHSNQVLKDIDIQIPAKQLTAIIGPSGCGKTTLLKSFNRLLEIQDGIKIQGEIIVDGINIMSSGLNVPDIRKKMGLISQKPYPLPMSIFENVAYGLRIHHDKSQKELAEAVQNCLQEVGLWSEVKDRLHDPASRLSVGQQQRLCLARSLVLQPEVILLDEPTSGLDPISTGKVEATLQELKVIYTIILVPHSVQQAARVAAYAAFFLQGEIIEQRVGREIFITPKDSRTEDYIMGRFG
jgi:phosphate transport system ATP-binding protein